MKPLDPASICFAVVCSLFALSIVGCGTVRERAEASPIVDGAPQLPGADSSVRGFITYFRDAQIYRVDAWPWAQPHNISAELDALGAGVGPDELVNPSPDGEWLVMSTERFHGECAGWPCLTVVSIDMSRMDVIVTTDGVVHADGTAAAIASGGEVVVYADDGGPHAIDLFAVRRSGIEWAEPQLLTGESPHEYNSAPAISDDGSAVVFDCGPEPYARASICRVDSSGAGFAGVANPSDVAATALRHADFDRDGAVVFEAERDGSEIYRLPAGGGPLQRVGTGFSDDGAPCVLPNGQIASVWFGNPDNASGEAELKVMSADGMGHYVLLGAGAAADANLGCGRREPRETR